jgi:hypothetical protein
MPNWSSLRPSALALSILGGAFVAAPSGAAVFYVGTGTGCTHQFLSQAITAAGANGADLDLIRIASPALAIGNLLLEVNNQSVQITGGFPNCTTANPTGRTTITFLSPDGDAGFWIHGAVALERYFGLNRIDMVMGADAGRGLTLQDLATVVLDDATIDSGKALDGAGALMQGEVLLTLQNGSIIRNGHADGSGGGIHCSSGGAIFVADTSHVDHNFAALDGAGIFANDCALSIEGSVYTNTSHRNGGGIYAGGGSIVEILGEGPTPNDLASVRSNAASEGGGGLYLIDSGTSATARNARIDENSASYGGGVWMGSSVSFAMDVDPSTCRVGRNCSSLYFNAASSGGAISVGVGSQASIRQTEIHLNFSYGAGGDGSVAFVGGTLTLEGCEVYNNAPFGEERNRFWVISGGTLTVAFSTVVESTAGGNGAFRNDSGSTFRLLSSIVQADATFHAPASATNLKCVITKEQATFPAGGANITTVTDPNLLFQDPAMDYRLKRNSVAQDYCDTASYFPLDGDTDNQARGYDDPTEPNILGAFDLGADEWWPALFADGFESGDRSLWSSATP